MIAGSFAGYFLLQTSKPDNISAEVRRSLVLLVSCLGFLLSLGWYLVNRGSKYWQENWERHVDLLESKIVGPLYKTTISPEEFPWLKVHKGFPYSVTTINQLISLFVVLVWLGFVIGSVPLLIPNGLVANWPWFLVTLTLVFTVFLFIFGKGGSAGKSRRINFRESELEDTKSTRDEAAKRVASPE